MSKKDDKETGIKEYIKERHKMNGLESSAIYSQTDLIDYIQSLFTTLFTSIKKESQVSAKELPSRVIKDVDLSSSNLDAISAGVGGGRRYKNIIKKTKKKSQKKNKKKLRKKTKKKTKKKSDIYKSKIQKGGFDISLLHLNESKLFLWNDVYSFRNVNIQRAFILEARVIWESMVQWKCMRHTWNLSGYQMARDTNLKTHVISDLEFFRRFDETMNYYRENARRYPGMYYDYRYSERITRNDINSTEFTRRERARFYMCNQLIKHALLNSSSYSENLWYYYLYHHIGVVLKYLYEHPRFLNIQLIERANPSRESTGAPAAQIPINRLETDRDILSRLVHGCQWIPRTYFKVIRGPAGYEYHDIWNTPNRIRVPVISNVTGEVQDINLYVINPSPGNWQWASGVPRRLASLNVRLIDPNARENFLDNAAKTQPPEEIDTYLSDRRGLIETGELSEGIQIYNVSCDIPYNSFSCIAKPSHNDHWHVPEHPETGFGIIMPLLGELMNMLSSNHRLEFTMKELLLAVYWYPNFASCKMICILKRNSNFYNAYSDGDMYNNKYKQELSINLSILEFNLFNKIIDQCATSNYIIDDNILKWNSSEILLHNKWLRRTHIQRLYGRGELLNRIRDSFGHPPDKHGTLVNELMRGEYGILSDDYLYGGEKRQLFESKLPERVGGGGAKTRSWSTANMDEMISIDWTGPASFTNNLYNATHFTEMYGLNDYEKSYEYFTRSPRGDRARVIEDQPAQYGNYINIMKGQEVVILERYHQPPRYRGYVVGNPSTVGFFAKICVELINPVSDAETFNSGNYVDLNTNSDRVNSNSVHRIIRIKGSYFLTGSGELEYKEGEFRAAGGFLSNTSRHGEEFEYILPEGIILINRIIQKEFPDKNSLFVELSGRYLHHSHILIYIREYINKSLQGVHFPITPADVDVLISKDNGRMIMEAYRTFKSGRQGIASPAGSAERAVAEQQVLSAHPWVNDLANSSAFRGFVAGAAGGAAAAVAGASLPLTGITAGFLGAAAAQGK